MSFAIYSTWIRGPETLFCPRILRWTLRDLGTFPSASLGYCTFTIEQDAFLSGVNRARTAYNIKNLSEGWKTLPNVRLVTSLP
jgi:hypothetical protein